MPEQRSPLCVGVIGCGWLATEFHLAGITRVPDLALIAVCDLDEPRARAAAARFQVGAHYTDYRRMLDERRLDVVGIIGPPELHVAAGVACLERGLPFLIEKPMATSRAAAGRLAQAAARHGDCGMVGFTSRFCPAQRLAWQVSRRSEFGPVTYVATTHLTNCHMHPMWDLGDPIEAFVYLHGVHAIDLWRYHGGDPATVSATSAGLAALSPTEFRFGSILARVAGANGPHGVIHMKAGASHNGDINADVMGATGRVRVEDDQTLTYENGQEPARRLLADDVLADAILAETPVSLAVGAGLTAHSYYPDYFRFEWLALARMLRRGLPLSPSIADAWRTACVTDAIVMSLRAGGATTAVNYSLD